MGRHELRRQFWFMLLATSAAFPGTAAAEPLSTTANATLADTAPATAMARMTELVLWDMQGALVLRSDGSALRFTRYQNQSYETGTFTRLHFPRLNRLFTQARQVTSDRLLNRGWPDFGPTHTISRIRGPFNTSWEPEFIRYPVRNTPKLQGTLETAVRAVVAEITWQEAAPAVSGIRGTIIVESKPAPLPLAAPPSLYLQLRPEPIWDFGLDSYTGLDPRRSFASLHIPGTPQVLAETGIGERRIFQLDLPPGIYFLTVAAEHPRNIRKSRRPHWARMPVVVEPGKVTNVDAHIYP